MRMRSGALPGGFLEAHNLACSYPQQDLPQVEEWLKDNKLSLNVLKTHAMLISTEPKHKTLKNQGESLKLKIRNDELDVEQKTKYLGVQTDSKLDWKEHIKTVSSKVSRAIGF